MGVLVGDCVNWRVSYGGVNPALHDGGVDDYDLQARGVRRYSAAVSGGV